MALTKHYKIGATVRLNIFSNRIGIVEKVTRTSLTVKCDGGTIRLTTHDEKRFIEDKDVEVLTHP